MSGCGEAMPGDQETPAPFNLSAGTQPATLAGGPSGKGCLVVTHGGVGSPPEWSADCQRAANSALVAVERRESALRGAVVGTATLENIPRFNAGTGANIRLDGKTIQMDAAVMTSDGNFAAVAAIERVRNPVLVAQAVLDTPHRLLVGEGATRFAHRIGFVDIVPTCPEAEAKYQRRLQKLLQGEVGGGFDSFDWRECWNYPTPVPEAPPTEHAVDLPETGDTVGTVVRAADGTFAASLSTGGTSITLHGRVGDVPIYGCGCYAGPAGAVACTGFGEEIIRHAMARTVYTFLEKGLSARTAVTRACQLFGEEYSLGVIAVGRTGWAVAANRPMAYGMATRAEGD
jgi:isoaspartyl peptidase/L-asparaginase-like protein (Ntn-hydrolase superfamily)